MIENWNLKLPLQDRTDFELITLPALVPLLSTASGDTLLLLVKHAELITNKVELINGIHYWLMFFFPCTCLFLLKFFWLDTVGWNKGCICKIWFTLTTHQLDIIVYYAAIFGCKLPRWSQSDCCLFLDPVVNMHWNHYPFLLMHIGWDHYSAYVYVKLFRLIASILYRMSSLCFCEPTMITMSAFRRKFLKDPHLLLSNSMVRWCSMLSFIVLLEYFCFLPEE